ncbi:MAG: preprotein translocase subunit SecY [Nanoarchaeota archaeon]|jgi:preprotein translocase subunit SecY|nr:preprotein translocase subunit SecY [Nanoarchaeota archaeon]
MGLKQIFAWIPEVTRPDDKKLNFNAKLKWTLIVLTSFFVMANIPLYGLTRNALERFEYLAIIMGTDFGSIISLGIGPIVMASIILQLLAGAEIIKIDTSTVEGKKFFQGLQKLLVLFFIVFEAMVYVFMNGLQPMEGFAGILIIQLILGGLAIYFMNELSEKWGFGSGVSLFIAAGVSWRLFTSAFQFMDQQGVNCLADFSGTPCAGKVLSIIQSIVTRDATTLVTALSVLIVTVLVFLAVVWAQSLKVEIPLSYGKIRGYGVKWPLAFFYASVIPVILAAALIANIQLFGGLIENWLGHSTFLGHFVDGQAVSGLSLWLQSTNILDLAIKGGLLPIHAIQAVIHLILYGALCMVFSIFWVKSSGMDARAQAKKIADSGLQVAGFRQDIRILESILDRYIMPLTVMGGLAIGFLAAFTNLLGALVSGTAILLVIMIMFQFYQSIAQQHMTDMNPAMKKFMGGQ